MNVDTTIARKGHTLTVSDGTELFFKDWGRGKPIVVPAIDDVARSLDHKVQRLLDETVARAGSTLEG